MESIDRFELVGRIRAAQRFTDAAGEKPIGGDVDWRRLREHVLDPLRRNQHARY
jgi:hypothetical protein